MSEMVVGFVPGVTPRKWFTTWASREPTTIVRGEVVHEHQQLEALRSGRVRMCFVRLPFSSADHHLIPLYRELPVAIVPADHFATAAEELTFDDIAEEVLELPEEMSWQDRVAVVAGGAGVLIAPMSVAREFHRKDLAWRVVIDHPPTQIGLAWTRDDQAPEIEAFIGVVRGRTARSSRGAGTGDEPAPPSEPRSASQRRPRRPSTRAASGRKRPAPASGSGRKRSRRGRRR